MKILYQLPNPHTVYAGRTIYFGYKHAFEDMGYQFKTLTPETDQTSLFKRYRPDIFITSIGPLSLRFLNLDLVRQEKKRGMKVLVNIPAWKSPFSRLRFNETGSVSKNRDWVNLIRSGNLGDIYFNVFEQHDPRMKGFESQTGYRHITIPLAADKTVMYPEMDKKYRADISFIGTYLPEKREFFQDVIFPLREKMSVRIYGQDWTALQRLYGNMQRVGQFFNIPGLRSMQSPQLDLDEERKVYTSSLISVNVHEQYQRRFGKDCNERTFKIPLAGGFEICDDVAVVKKYFKEGTEIVIAKSKKDWLDKIDYYVKYPNKRLKIIELGKKKVLQQHTYHHRIKTLLHLIKRI